MGSSICLYAYTFVVSLLLILVVGILATVLMLLLLLFLLISTVLANFTHHKMWSSTEADMPMNR